MTFQGLFWTTLFYGASCTTKVRAMVSCISQTREMLWELSNKRCRGGRMQEALPQRQQ